MLWVDLYFLSIYYVDVLYARQAREGHKRLIVD